MAAWDGVRRDRGPRGPARRRQGAGAGGGGASSAGVLGTRRCARGVRAPARPRANAATFRWRRARGVGGDRPRARRCQGGRCGRAPRRSRGRRRCRRRGERGGSTLGCRRASAGRRGAGRAVVRHDVDLCRSPTPARGEPSRAPIRRRHLRTPWRDCHPRYHRRPPRRRRGATAEPAGGGSARGARCALRAGGAHLATDAGLHRRAPPGRRSGCGRAARSVAQSHHRRPRRERRYRRPVRDHRWQVDDVSAHGGADRRRRRLLPRGHGTVGDAVARGGAGASSGTRADVVGDVVHL